MVLTAKTPVLLDVLREGREATVFRVKSSEIRASIPKAAAIVITVAGDRIGSQSGRGLSSPRRISPARGVAGAVTPISAAEIRPLQRAMLARGSSFAPPRWRCLFSAPSRPCGCRQHQFAIRRELSQIKLFARDILASMDEGVITTDQNGTITSVNSAAIGILAVGPDCVGQPLANVSAAGVSLAALAGEVADRNESLWDRDFTLDHGGSASPNSPSRPRTEGGRKRWRLGCLFLLRDVSDRVLIEERIRRMERIISLGTLASGLHHEIKNPLTALSIHVQLFDKRLRDPGPCRPVDELIGVLKAEVLRLNGVLESFHDFASLLA